MIGKEPILYLTMNLQKNLVMTRFTRQKADDHILLGKKKFQENNTKKKKKKVEKKKKGGVKE
jgi:hypothetical protein